MRQHLVVARFFDVQDFSLKREDGLEAAVAALFGGSAGGLAFDEEEFAAIGIALGAVGEFAGKASTIERAFAAGEVASLAGGLTGTRCVDRFVDDFAGDGCVLLEKRAQLFVDYGLHDSGDIGVELALGLAFELRLRQLHADHRDQAFANIVAGEIFFDVLEQAHLLARVVDGTSKCGAEAGEVRASVDGVDVIGEAKDGFGVGVVVLQADLDMHLVFVGFHIDGLVVEGLLAAVQVLDEFDDAAVVLELGALGLAGLGIGGALVGERNGETAIQKGHLAQTLRQGVEVIFGRGENGTVGQEVDARTPLSWSRRLSSACWWARLWSKSAPR